MQNEKITIHFLIRRAENTLQAVLLCRNASNHQTNLNFRKVNNPLTLHFIYITFYNLCNLMGKVMITN